MTYTWHPERDGFGTVLGPYNESLGGYPIEGQGYTFAQAVERFGNVEAEGEIPVTIERPRCPVCGGLNPGDITHTRC